MKYFVAANWKCNPVRLQKAKKLFSNVEEETKKLKKTKIIIFPPFLYIPFYKKEKSGFEVGAQNLFFESGAYTGEISPLMLKDLGVGYALVGHSERRRYFNENGRILSLKINAALEAGLKVIFCIGETKEERDANKTKKILTKQLNEILPFIPKNKFSSLIIAYEPVWAIGAENPCSPEEGEKSLSYIRKIISSFCEKKMPVIYGGSINSRNVISFLEKTTFQGFLIGRASLNSKEFSKIIKIVEARK